MSGSKLGNQANHENLRYIRPSQTAPKHITSGKMFSPTDTRGSLDKAQAPPSWKTGEHSEVQKHKYNSPRNPSASPQSRTTSNTDNHDSKGTNKVGGFSPFRERKDSLEAGQGVASSIPAKSPLRVSGRPAQSHEEGTPVPKFGAWDEGNPASGEVFTGIFNKVSQEKQNNAVKVPTITDDSIYLNSFHRNARGDKSTNKCCFFSWGRK